MPKSIYVQFLLEQPNSNSHYLNRLIKVLNYFISIEPTKKTKGYESHHIAPRSWKPEWDKVPENHLKVPAKAHYVIHHLMWKAFPSDRAMILAFHRIKHRTDQKITAKIYSLLKIEFRKSQSKSNRERVIDGSHNLLGGEIARQSSLKRIADKTHNLLGREYSKKN